MIALSPAQPAHTGHWVAWLCGYGSPHTDTLAQTVRIPSLATSISLSFWLHIDTQETTGTLKNDVMTVQVTDLTDPTRSKSLATYSNLDHNVGYAQKTFSLSASTYAGHTRAGRTAASGAGVRIHVRGAYPEDHFHGQREQFAADFVRT